MKKLRSIFSFICGSAGLFGLVAAMSKAELIASVFFAVATTANYAFTIHWLTYRESQSKVEK
jgi:hypothetical protein